MNIAILIPCHNEEKTVGLVVDSFKRFMPESTIYVYDNLSLDKTAEVAKKSGAIVRSEINKGKGNVMRRMFADIESDIYIIVDGDNTYDASMSAEMVDYLIKNNVKFVSNIDLNILKIKFFSISKQIKLYFKKKNIKFI